MKSKQRVADHGEVFTPGSVVDAMIDLVASEAARVDARFLEPACGSGNFLLPVLRRKLATVNARYRQSEFELRHQGLLGLMSIYGIELLGDNVGECRANLVEIFAADLALPRDDVCLRAAEAVTSLNIVHGDARTMQTLADDPQPISFAEWSYLGKGTFGRRDFRFDTLTQMSSFGAEDTLFADLGKHDIFTPTRDHGKLSMSDIAGSAHD